MPSVQMVLQFGGFRFVLMSWICLHNAFSPSDAQTTEFASSPSNVSYVLQGNNVTLQWKYTLSSSDDSRFHGVIWDEDYGDSYTYKRLYSVSKTDVKYPGTNLGVFSGHVHDAGSSYSSKLASFKLSDVQQVHTNERFVCGIYIGAGPKYSQPVYIKLGKLPGVSFPENPKTCNKGQQCTLQCTVTGTPVPSISWTKTGQTTVLSTSANYIIPTVQRSQSGTYKCKGTNQFGLDEKEMRLDVNYKPENVKLQSNDADNSVTEGDSLTLTCSSDAQPSPTYSFYHQNNKKTETSSTRAGTLQINQVTDSDHGQWNCQAKNSLGSTKSPNINLYVQVPPQLAQTPSDLAVSEGDDVTFQCQASGRPAPTITWTDPSGQTKTGPTYTKNNVQRTDQGEYQCKASNGVGDDVTVKVFLTVNYKPDNVVLKSNDADNTVTVGDSLNLTCSSDAQPSATYSFYHQNNKKTDTSSTRAGTLQINKVTVSDHGQWKCQATNIVGSKTSPNLSLYVADTSSSRAGTLQINKVSDSDHGQWSCQAVNTLGSKTSPNVSLYVAVPPKFTQQPNDQTVYEGSSITFQCQATGRPTPTITWTDPSGETKAGPTLTKNNVQRTDQGEYQCTASNGVGNDVTAKTSLTVNYVDVDLSSSPSKVESCDNHKTELKCVAAGQPNSFNFTWSGPITQQVVNDGSVSKLIFTPTQDSHYGEYKCQVQNSAGTAQHVMKLQRIKPPKAPDIESAVFSTSSIKLTWTVPGQKVTGCGVTRFTVEWKKVKGDSPWISVKTKLYSYQIDEIEEDTEYIIKVSAWNAAGQGPKSSIQNIIVKTSSQVDCQTWQALFGVSFTLLLVIILCVCVFIYRRKDSPCLERQNKKTPQEEAPYSDQSRAANQNEAFYMELQPSNTANSEQQPNYESVQSNITSSANPAPQTEAPGNYQPLHQSGSRTVSSTSPDQQSSVPSSYQPLRQPRPRRSGESGAVPTIPSDQQSSSPSNYQPLRQPRSRINEPSKMVPNTTYQPLTKNKKTTINTQPNQEDSYEISPEQPGVSTTTNQPGNVNKQPSIYRDSGQEDSYEISPIDPRV